MAHGEGAKGNPLLFLIPEELQYLSYLESEEVRKRVYFRCNEAGKRAVSSAKDAYTAYLMSYISHSMKDVFNVRQLKRQAVASSFCFSCPPKLAMEKKKQQCFEV